MKTKITMLVSDYSNKVENALIDKKLLQDELLAVQSTSMESNEMKVNLHNMAMDLKLKEEVCVVSVIVSIGGGVYFVCIACQSFCK